MSQRLTTRPDTPTETASDRIRDRITATDATLGTRPAKPPRLGLKPPRTLPAKTGAAVRTMSYQLGFHSGPGG
jgi:hypothetical protein